MFIQTVPGATGNERGRCDRCRKEDYLFGLLASFGEEVDPEIGMFCARCAEDIELGLQLWPDPIAV